MNLPTNLTVAEQELANAMFRKYGVVLETKRPTSPKIDGLQFYLDIKEEKGKGRGYFSRSSGVYRLVLEAPDVLRQRSAPTGWGRIPTRWVRIDKYGTFDVDKMADKMWELYKQAKVARDRERIRDNAVKKARTLRADIADVTGKSEYDFLFEVKYDKLYLRIPVEDMDKALRVLDAAGLT